MTKFRQEVPVVDKKLSPRMKSDRFLSSVTIFCQIGGRLVIIFDIILSHGFRGFDKVV